MLARPLVLMLILAGSVIPQNYYSNLIPLGGHEAMLGNTGTGGIGSPAAAYYNPAALTQLKGSSISFSGSSILIAEVDFHPIANIDGTDLNFDAFGTQSFPSGTVSVKKMGSWVAALAAFVPFRQEFEDKVNWGTYSNGGVSQIFSQAVLQEDFWLGAALGRRVGDRFSLGISVYGIRHKDRLSSIQQGTATDPGRFLANILRIKTLVLNGISALGLLYEQGNIDLGLRIQSPTFRVYGQGEYLRSTISSIGGSGEIEFSLIDEEGLSARYHLPLDVRCGLHWRATDRFDFLLDVSYHFERDYDLFDSPDIMIVRDSRGVLRLNAGASLTLTERLKVSAGTLYNPSARQTRLNENDYFSGASAGLLYSTEHVQTGLTAFYYQGSGQADLPLISGSSLSSRNRFLGGMLTSSYTF